MAKATRGIPWVALALLSGGLFAQSQTVLVDGTTLAGFPTSVDAEGRLLIAAENGVRAVAPNTVLRAESGNPATGIAAGERRVVFLSGDELLCTYDEGGVDQLRIAATGAGSFEVLLDQVRRIIVPENLPRGLVLPELGTSGDRLYLNAGTGLDPIPGEIVRVTRSSVVWTLDGDEDRSYALEGNGAVAILDLEPAAPFVEPKDLLCVATLRNGSRLTGRLISGGAAGIGLALTAGPKVVLDPAQLSRLDFKNGAFAFLSDMAEAAFSEVPFLEGGQRFGLLRDRGFEEEYLSVGETRFVRGLGLHARSRADFALEGAFASFVAQVGCDSRTADRGTPGSVSIVIEVDGKERYKSPVLWAGQAPERVVLEDLKGAKVLTLRAEYGKSFNIGARAVFGEALLRR